MKNTLTELTIKSLIFLTVFLIFHIVLQAQSKEDKLDELLSIYAINNTFNGTAVVYYKGNIVLNRTYGFRNTDDKTTANEDTVFQVGSLTKQFTAAVILKLQENGKLSVNDKVSKYLPDFPHRETITIQHLLTHTSGIYNYTDNGEFIVEK